MQIRPIIGQRPSASLLQFVLKSLLATLVGFSSFRLLLVLLNLERIHDLALGLVLQLMLWGLGNDLLVVALLFWLPLLLGILQPLGRPVQRILAVVGLVLTGLIMHLSLILSSLDIPFFQHFFSHISDMVLNWRDQLQFLIRMVAEESRFWWFIGLFLLLSVLVWWWILRRLPQIVRGAVQQDRGKLGYSVGMVVLLLLLSLLLRSRLIRRHHFALKDTAVIIHPMLEKLSQNPLLTLGYALTSRPVGELLAEALPIERAAALLDSSLNRSIDLRKDEPMAQTVPGTGAAEPLNVVLVLMESINIERLDSGLMPRLQEIAAQGLKWDNFFSAGVHTYAGLYATLCSYPVQLRRHAMKWDSDLAYAGLATVLKRNGYQTQFFTTHDERFDNMEPFLKKNGFDRIVGQDRYDYRAVSTFGVPDHVMFERALTDLDDEGGKRPFLAVLLSASNHAPFRFPDGIPFQAKSRSLPQRMIEYSDWALGRFWQTAATKEWAKRTVFVFLGDHGASGDVRFPLPYSMVHVPMIMAGAGLPETGTVRAIGSQLDVMPTILGRLGLAYRNLGFGVDLLASRRSLAVFCNDEYLGCTDGEYLLSFNFDRTWPLQRLTDAGRSGSVERAAAMKETALSFWRMADWLLGEKRQYRPQM